MKKYKAFIWYYSVCNVEFEANDNLSKDELEDIAYSKIGIPNVCYHCSKNIEIGEATGIIEVIEVKNDN